MSGRILFVTHEKTACAGRVGEVLRARGYTTTLCRPFLGDALPAARDVDAVVVFGGRMSVNDDHLDFIRAELDWIPTVLADGKPYLGICLGGQLLARALGARVARHPRGLHEIGYAPVRPVGAHDLIPAPMHVYQWHNEGFDVAAGAELLAAGDVFAHQAFRYGRAVGVQFHPEVTPSIVARWTESDPDLLRPEAQSRAHQVAAAPTHDPVVGRWLDGFFDRWLKAEPQTAAA